MKHYFKDWVCASLTGATAGGVLSFSGAVLSNKNNLRRKVKQVEDITLIGTSLGALVTGTIFNPILSGCLLLGVTFPMYYKAKFE